MIKQKLPDNKVDVSFPANFCQVSWQNPERTKVHWKDDQSRWLHWTWWSKWEKKKLFQLGQCHSWYPACFWGHSPTHATFNRQTTNTGWAYIWSFHFYPCGIWHGTCMCWCCVGRMYRHKRCQFEVLMFCVYELLSWVRVLLDSAHINVSRTGSVNRFSIRQLWSHAVWKTVTGKSHVTNESSWIRFLFSEINETRGSLLHKKSSIRLIEYQGVEFVSHDVNFKLESLTHR